MHTSRTHTVDKGYPEAHRSEAGHQEHESFTCLEGPYHQLTTPYSINHQPLNLSVSLKFSFNEA